MLFLPCCFAREWSDDGGWDACYAGWMYLVEGVRLSERESLSVGREMEGGAFECVCLRVCGRARDRNGFVCAWGLREKRERESAREGEGCFSKGDGKVTVCEWWAMSVARICPCLRLLPVLCPSFLFYARLPADRGWCREKKRGGSPSVWGEMGVLSLPGALGGRARGREAERQRNAARARGCVLALIFSFPASLLSSSCVHACIRDSLPGRPLTSLQSACPALPGCRHV